MTPKELRQRVVAELWRIFKYRGYGSIVDTQRKMGVGASYFKDWKHNRAAIDLERLGKALEVLEIDACDFFLSALSEDSEESKNRLPGQRPPGVQVYDERMAKRLKEK